MFHHRFIDNTTTTTLIGSVPRNYNNSKQRICHHHRHQHNQSVLLTESSLLSVRLSLLLSLVFFCFIRTVYTFHVIHPITHIKYSYYNPSNRRHHHYHHDRYSDSYSHMNHYHPLHHKHQTTKLYTTSSSTNGSTGNRQFYNDDTQRDDTDVAVEVNEGMNEDVMDTVVFADDKYNEDIVNGERFVERNDISSNNIITSLLLCISYDGLYFNGFSSANDQQHHSNNNNDDVESNNDVNSSNKNSNSNNTSSYTNIWKKPKRRSRRYRHIPSIENTNTNIKNQYIRSIQGTIQQSLCKLYSNILLQQMIVDGCCRTDTGVHATYMIVQIYAITKDALELSLSSSTSSSTSSSIGSVSSSSYVSITDSNSTYHNNTTLCNNQTHCNNSIDNNNDTTTISSLPYIYGKRLPHPMNGTDQHPFFIPLPINTNNNNNNHNKSLSMFITSLNRMLYPDIQIKQYAIVPSVYKMVHNTNSSSLSSSSISSETQRIQIPFHPSLQTHTKTYKYTFSIGPIHDPIQYRNVWYIGNYNNHTLDINNMIQASQCMIGTHNFNAFHGSPRSKSDQMKRNNNNTIQPYNTICTIESIQIIQKQQQHDQTNPIHYFHTYNNIQTYDIIIIGDRFLYKMIRFMVGALIAVGKQQLTIQNIQTMLQTGQRTTTTATNITNNNNITNSCNSNNIINFECAPPYALTLQHVQYDKNITIDWELAT